MTGTNRCLWLLFCISAIFIFSACGAKVEGIVIDGTQTPLGGIKVCADQDEKVKGYEHSEVQTGKDGKFTLKKLYPNSSFLVKVCDTAVLGDYGAFVHTKNKGETVIVDHPIMVRYQRRGAVIYDSKTNLEIAQLNRETRTWCAAQGFVMNIEIAGKKGWRLPTDNELSNIFYDATLKKALALEGRFSMWSGDERYDECWPHGFRNGHYAKIMGQFSYPNQVGVDYFSPCNPGFTKKDYAIYVLPVRSVSQEVESVPIISTAVCPDLKSSGTTDVPAAEGKPATTALLTQEAVTKALDLWVKAQNGRDISSYQELYGADFTGIKRTSSGKEYRYDRGGWLKDRQDMFSKAAWLEVSYQNLNITIGPVENEAKAEFKQIYKSDRYSDQGDKVMRFRVTDGKLLITFEEMIRSSKL